MKKTVKSADKILPYGDSLRGFLNQSYLTDSDLKDFLRDRGVFLFSYGKESTVPLITSTLIGPSEFDLLRESQGTREDNPKRTSEIINWQTDKSLRDVIAETRNEILEALIPDYSTCKLSGSPKITFFRDNPNEVNLSFNIERDDLNKSWYESKNEFKAEVTLTVDVEAKKLKITKTHTSEETKEVLSSLTRNIKSTLVQKQYVNITDKLEKILFKDFDNANRFYFLFNLASKLNNSALAVVYKDIYDIEFKPDQDASLPNELQWMSDKSKVIFVGKSIENTNFLQVSENYKLLILWNVIASYTFNVGGIKGTLSLQIGFPDYPRNSNQQAELIVIPIRLSITDNNHASKKPQLTKLLLDELDKLKFEIYNQHKLRSLN